MAPGSGGSGDVRAVVPVDTGDTGALGGGVTTGGGRFDSIGAATAAADHSMDARTSSGGATVGSCGYAVRAWLRSWSPCVDVPISAPPPARTTISFHPARST